MTDAHQLQKLATGTMPFGRYKGARLMDLPERYLLWFEREGFPQGELGVLLQLLLEIDRNGLKHLLTPLRNEPRRP